MSWSIDFNDVATSLLSGSGFAIFVTIFVAVLLPVSIHLCLYRPSRRIVSSDFLLLGPSGSGKTAFCTLLGEKPPQSQDSTRATHTSQSTSITSARLHPSARTGADRFRSQNDPSLKHAATNRVRCRLRDTPGHGKLRASEGISQLVAGLDPKQPKASVRGVVFFIDAASLADTAQLADTAGYFYDVLMALQEKAEAAPSKKKGVVVPVLVAANKQDLFAAIPAELVKEKLETEIDRVRRTRSRGIVDANVKSSFDKEEAMLAGDNEVGKFTFDALEIETGVKVDVIGGTLKSEDKNDKTAGVREWEHWIAGCL